MESFFSSWPWYVAGPLIGLFVPLLLIVGNKLFGISSSFLHFCSFVIPKKKFEALKYNLDENRWKLFFVIGILIGGFIAVNFLSDNKVHFLPDDYYSAFGYLKLFAGGLLVGFGTRYADGCTSGHSITGLAHLQRASFKATIAFFIGGLIYTFSSYFLG